MSVVQGKAVSTPAHVVSLIVNFAGRMRFDNETGTPPLVDLRVNPAAWTVTAGSCGS